jgi:hypothetical protein
MLMVPVLSNVRWSANLDRMGLLPPWKSSAVHPERRVVLMSTVASASTGPKKCFLDMCRTLRDPNLCRYIVLRGGCQRGKTGASAMRWWEKLKR